MMEKRIAISVIVDGQSFNPADPENMDRLADRLARPNDSFSIVSSGAKDELFLLLNLMSSSQKAKVLCSGNLAKDLLNAGEESERRFWDTALTLKNNHQTSVFSVRGVMRHFVHRDVVAGRSPAIIGQLGVGVLDAVLTVPEVKEALQEDAGVLFSRVEAGSEKHKAEAFGDPGLLTFFVKMGFGEKVMSFAEGMTDYSPMTLLTPEFICTMAEAGFSKRVAKLAACTASAYELKELLRSEGMAECLVANGGGEEVVAMLERMGEDRFVRREVVELLANKHFVKLLVDHGHADAIKGVARRWLPYNGGGSGRVSVAFQKVEGRPKRGGSKRPFVRQASILTQ